MSFSLSLNEALCKIYVNIYCASYKHFHVKYCDVIFAPCHTPLSVAQEYFVEHMQKLKEQNFMCVNQARGTAYTRSRQFIYEAH